MTSDRFNEIIAQYLKAAEKGNPPDRDQLLTQHPDLSEELRSFFAQTATLPSTRGSDEEATLPPSEAETIETAAEPGTTARYFADYELLEEIARGGMGVVYKARQLSLNRIVALKMILAGQLASQQDVQRFHAEAEAAANLDHPGIVPIHEVGQHQGQHYFSMGFVDGESLADKIQQGPLPPRRATELAISVAQAVHYAHERDVIHRDLKPANVLLDKNDQPRVTDFGLAKRMDDDSHLTGTGQVLGTPSYMPPEQAAGKLDEIAPTADIYALGAILYCMLAGRPPFQAASPMDTLLQVLEQDPIPPRQLNPQVPVDLDTICLKCLEKDAKRRYRTAAELVEELQRHLRGIPIQARPVGRAERLWRWCRRNPLLAGMTGSLVVLVLTLAIGGPLIALRQVTLLRRAEKAQRERALAQVNALLAASPAAVPVIIDNLKPAYQDLLPRLRELRQSPQLSETEQVRVSLALLPVDSGQVEYLKQRMMASPVEEFLLIRQSLQTHQAVLVPDLWKTARGNQQAPPQRFRAACALALFDAHHPHWEEIGDEVAQFLVSQNSLLASQWMQALRPARVHLLQALSKIFGERSEQQAPRRILATSILADYAADDPDLLVKLLIESDAQQFSELFPPLSRHQDRGVSLLETVVQRCLEAWQTNELTDAAAQQGANAAVALLQLGQQETVWPLLKHARDPRLRSYLLHRFHSRATPAALLVDKLSEETDAGILQALILALGEYPRDVLAQSQQRALERFLVDLHRDTPDAGIHSAVAWLLGRWQREAALSPIKEQLATTGDDGRRRWYINHQGQTFALLGPAVFAMGSPPGEAGRREDEVKHMRRIERCFAVATKEVTVTQFQRFLKQHPETEHTYSQQHSPLPNCPQTSVTWYEAAAYCNWLSKQDAIPESEWCFVPNHDGKYAAGMRLADDYLTRSGYRLPTEAEWEFACRGGSSTARFYGESEDLMGQYAWYLANALDRSWEVGRTKPNQFGLFDMHGNVWEWCAHGPDPYPADTSEAVADTVIDRAPLRDGQPRALRGGSYFYHYIYTRCALRNKEPVDARYYGIGLRPVRTMP